MMEYWNIVSEQQCWSSQNDVIPAKAGIQKTLDSGSSPE